MEQPVFGPFYWSPCARLDYVLPVQRWQPWQVEPLIRLVMGICLLLGASSLGVLALMKISGELGSGIEFPSMVWHTVVFHGGTVLLVTLFLREQDLSWRAGFGIPTGDWRCLVKPVLQTTVACLVSAQLLGRLAAIVIEWATGKAPEVQTTVTLLQDSKSWFQVGYIALVTVVMAPVAEELLFRGILYRALCQYKGNRVALWVSSLLFGLIHANTLSLVPLVVMAVLLALLYERTKTLMAPIATHALFNLANFVMLFS